MSVRATTIKFAALVAVLIEIYMAMLLCVHFDCMAKSQCRLTVDIESCISRKLVIDQI